jgi:glutaredoxin
LLSDFWPHGKIAHQYGVLRSEGYSERAIFVIDRAGVIRYVDVHKIDEQPDNEVLFGVLEALEPHRRLTAAPHPDAPAAYVIPDHPVVMFCTPWCPDCRRARVWFKDQGIDFLEVDVSKDRVAARQVREWNAGKEITPTFKIGETIFNGFDMTRLSRAVAQTR